MVKVRADLPTTEQGAVDYLAWADALCEEYETLNASALHNTTTWLADHNVDQLLIGMELAELVAQLKLDLPSVQAALIYRGVREGSISGSKARELVGEEGARIAFDVAEMATTSLLEMSNSPLLEKEQQDQVENIKRMLVSMIRDARVAAVKLAERVITLRHAKNFTAQRRLRVATEAKEVFAALAGRLGIWQLKWELEDLSLRYTQQDVYKSIASNLQGKRAEREIQIEHMIDQVRGLLRGHGIDAAVYGRAKHIYSIWKKMQKKAVAQDDVHDVRAVRVVVNTIAECYAALGVLHTTWRHKPSEFDDYIANPKENGYQSIHTAVTASDGATLEIQIRTMAMHEDAELGVCAHWSYKDGANEEPAFSAKMDWMRQVMEWHDDIGGSRNISHMLVDGGSEDRIFVSTPKGHVLELPTGATVLDFAYRVHTDVGHATRGARVNGMLTSLDYELETGQQVEIITEANGCPMRDWLEEELALVRTDRAKAKLFRYFRNLSAADQIKLGEAALEQKLSALGLTASDQLDLAGYLLANDFENAEALYKAVGQGERSSIDVVVDMFDRLGFDQQQNLPGVDSPSYPQAARIRIEGHNRDGFLHDVTQVIARLGIALVANTGRVSNDASQAIITVDVTVLSLLQSLKLISYLGLVEGVTAIRKESG